MAKKVRYSKKRRHDRMYGGVGEGLFGFGQAEPAKEAVADEAVAPVATEEPAAIEEPPVAEEIAAPVIEEPVAVEEPPVAEEVAAPVVKRKTKKRKGKNGKKGTKKRKAPCAAYCRMQAKKRYCPQPM